MWRAAGLWIINQTPNHFVSMLEPPLVLHLVLVGTVELLGPLAPPQDLFAFASQPHFEHVRLLLNVFLLLDPLLLCEIVRYVF